MAELEVETMPEREDDTQAEADDSMVLETKEEAAPKAVDETTLEDEVGDEAEGEQKQQPQQKDPKQHDKFGILVLAGEIEEYDPGGNNPHTFDVVAVHGLHGDRENTWTTEGTSDKLGRNWLKDHIYERYPGSRILTFGYDASNAKAGIYTMARIREKALQLLDDLVELRKASNPNIFRPVVFIAHDLGGIIVKEALWIATLEYRKYRSIKDSARLLIFFGCPHRYTSTQDMEDKVANLVFANKTPRPVGVTGSIKALGRSIIEINEFFAVSNMPSLLSIVNVYSEEEDAALQVFDKYAATLDIPFEERIGCPKPHGDMCKFARYGDLYKRIDWALNRYPSPLRPNNESVECLQTLQLLAAPVYPLESLYGPEHRFNWISLHETYTKWLDSYGPNILHVHGTTNASDASEYIFQCLDVYRAAKQKNEILLYFTFSRHNDRCNSVMAMLNTFLAQIFNHSRNLYSSVKLQYEEMSFHRSWTQTDLLLVFRNILSNLDHSGIFCVINGLDECDDSRMAFLENLCSFARQTERRFKIVITSTVDSDLQAALADWPTINLDDQSEDPDTAKTNLASDVDLEVLELIQQRPAFCDFEKTITEQLFECGQDKHLRRLVLNQLRLSKSRSTKSATQRELDLLRPTTSKDIFARILTRVPSERRAWARKALSWILYAFHPLLLRELGAALALEVDSLSGETIELDEPVSQQVIADLDEVFAGLFIVEHNEVHFGHPDAREFLLAADGTQEGAWYDVRETAHQEIADTCQFYLSLQQVQDSIAMSHNKPLADPLESPTFIPPFSLLFYAIKYWPRHYKLIAETSRPTERALEFVQNTKTMRHWAEAYWSLSNPISRTDRAFLSLLPIFAGLGLQDLVAEWLDVGAETPTAGRDRALALAEAARNAHVEMVRMLLSYGGYTQASLQDALVAGASCCDAVVLDELVTYAAKSIENFEWPPALLCRAAQFGLENTAQKLLKSGASLDTAITIHDLRPLHLAARHGHAEVVKILLEHKAPLSSSSGTSKHVPLHVASMYGHAAIVRLLLDGGADANVRNADKTNAMGCACMTGNHKVVEILAEAGCDMAIEKPGDWSPLTMVASEGFVNSARFLLEKKANTEVEGQSNWTPLRYAALKGHVELCRLLLENRANANTLSGGAPILDESASRGNLEVVKLLVENGATVDAVDFKGWTALQKASEKGHVLIATYLLDHGADINHTNEDGDTPILLASEAGFAELVQLLINRGADLHCTDTDGWTPIHLSSYHAETTRVLIENGADANRIANYHTPLFLAAEGNHIEVVKVLLSFNPDLEIQHDDDSYSTGYTALTIATVNGYTDVVRLLLEAGANVNHRSKRNISTLQYAVYYNREDIVRSLMEYHPELDHVDDDGDTALNSMQSSTSVAIAKLLINAGSDPEIRNNEGNTPLCKAVRFENVDIVKYLIAKKAELNIIGGKYGGPLHIACRWINLELVKILDAAGADVNLVDPTIGTPLQSTCLTCDYSRSNYDKEKLESVTRYLINEAKADVTAVGGLLRCALNAACVWSTPEMVKLILDKGAKIDAKDDMGRVAIHFAAVSGLEHFESILDAGADIEVRDKMGRTALHCAALAGLLNVVERIISLSKGLVDQADIDGWTPLLWAARGGDTDHISATSNAQEEIIKLLLDRGADPCIKGKGLDREWSPVKVARYHGADDAVVQLLIEKTKEKLAAKGKEDTWDEAFHASREALEVMAFCDSCLFNIYGIRYKCETCFIFDLCHKCYRSRHLIHPGHPFKTIGPEYENEQQDDDDDDTDSDDTDSDDTDSDDTDSDDTDGNDMDDDGSGDDDKENKTDADDDNDE